MQYSELTYPTPELLDLSHPFSTTFESDSNLDVQFSFRPAVFKNSLGISCSNTWKIQSVDNESNWGRISKIFDKFEANIAVDETDFEHIIISVDATVSEDWGNERRDDFPL